MGNSINAFLSGFLGSIGDDMQQKREQEIISKAREISSDRQILMTIWSDPNATPGAKARVLQALGGLGQEEGKLGKKPKKGEKGLDLSSIMGPIINMPAENQMGQVQDPSRPPIQQPAQSQQQSGVPGGTLPQSTPGFSSRGVVKPGLFRSQEEIAQEQQAEQERQQQQEIERERRKLEMKEDIDNREKEQEINDLVSRGGLTREAAVQRVYGIAPEKPAKPGVVSDTNASIANYFKLKGWNPDPNSPDYAAHWQQAHQAFTKETKIDPGVVRIEALGTTRGPVVTDTKTGVTAPMNWNQYNQLSRAEPGRYVASQYDPEALAGAAAGREMAPKNVGLQVQSYGTFIRHTGDLYNAISSLNNTNFPFMNKPINWLRTNSGNPQVRAFLAKLDPVRKEFESFLLNNRALYQDDRNEAVQLIDENASPAQMLAVLPSLIHTGSARLEEANEQYKRATGGKSIPNLVSPEATKVFKMMNLTPPGQDVGVSGGSHIYYDANGNEVAK